VADQKSPAVDPFTAWRDWLGQAERQLNSFFNDVMGREQYTRAMGQFNTFSVNMQKSMTETMSRYLSSLNLPNREDFGAIMQRLTAIEERLGAIEGNNGDATVASNAGHSAIAGTLRPPRTKKPPAAKGKGN
jgi:polyhydroxyalkanoic acid synthase PhaR subunit